MRTFDLPVSINAERPFRVPSPLSVSVCIATYNGSEFIRQQLASIIGQTERVDEIIVVDDASCDGTCDIIRSVGDPRVRLLENPENLGVVLSFERAIVNSAGDLIFLSDQDDLWLEHKVETFKCFFANHPGVTAVLSDARVIDQDGNEIRESWMGACGFQPGLIRNIVRNRYLGCAMAFRRSTLKYCIPFPSHIPMHDMWIGMMNRIYGVVGYIPEPLFSYRRHRRNLTTGRHAPFAQMLMWRLNLVFSIVRRILESSILSFMRIR